MPSSKAARAIGAPTIWVHDTHRNNVRRDREWLKRTPHCVEGTWGVEIIDDLGARDDEIHVIKRRYSSFFQTDLDVTLKDMMVDRLIVFGVVTNICVRSTVTTPSSTATRLWCRTTAARPPALVSRRARSMISPPILAWSAMRIASRVRCVMVP